MDVDPNSLDPELRIAKLTALASAALGIISLCAAIIPLCGATASLLGIGFGLFSRKAEKGRVATVGVAISVLGLLITIIYSLFLSTFMK
jgi:mannose/fructose/N-acetylgalactosamine-specific phosphotransferase system component IIC